MRYIGKFINFLLDTTNFCKNSEGYSKEDCSFALETALMKLCFVE